jgi:hypothetical protein
MECGAYQLLLLCFYATALSEKRRNKRFLTNLAKWYLYCIAQVAQVMKGVIGWRVNAIR